MGSLLGFGVLLVMVVTVGGLSPQVKSVGPPEHFLHQARAECHIATNGTRREVHFLDRFFWDRQEYVRFDNRVGEFRAVTELGKEVARQYNSEKAFLEGERHVADSFCLHNFDISVPFVSKRRVQPKVKITPTDYDRSSQNGLLICSVDGFFPLEIEIKWLRNGKEEDPHKVVTTDVMKNGDWTYQIHVMLETQFTRGDVFGCQVEHASFKGPVTVQWEPQTDSARSKKWTGVVGIVLGLVFLLPGLVLYLKNKKGRAIPQPGGLIS
ncbi:H-2 class II histocompatibility antigen, E-S beta chain-like [Hemicordylus capensis]|uniref:H-2 class II histocompatibility antigen, E-S beta chain-like n=1 Tax=Hemicordylus capensis TaxID=884348 RepID=UPI0023023060|nr:H-2 class II histocompatibility antigen, E-S beta chain-like [Hemicordylus capensis]